MILTNVFIAIAICFSQVLGVPSTHPRSILIIISALGKSHVQFTGQLTDALVKHGHVVDKLIAVWNTQVTANGTNNARNIYTVREPSCPYSTITHLNDPFYHGPNNVPSVFEACRLLFAEKILSDEVLIQTLRSNNYDMVLVNPFDGYSVPLAHVLKARSTAMFVATPSADYVYEALGIPTPPSYLSNVFRAIAPERQLTVFERLENFCLWINRHLAASRDIDHSIFTKYYPDTPRTSELYNRLSYVFVNTNELIDIGRPYSGKIKFIGGIHTNYAKESVITSLPEDYRQIVTSARKGTIILSLGSQILMDIVPNDIKKAFLEAFCMLQDYNFIWKHDNPESMSSVNATNVFFRKWIPQKELLASKRIRLFISHMGLNSYLELAYAGVPTVMIPLFADQEFNAGTAVRKGLGIMLRKNELNTQSILKALRTVLENPIYSDRAEKLSQLLTNQPFQPEEVFIRHINYAISFPETNDWLSLPSTNLNFIVANSLDSEFIIFVAALCIILVIVQFLRYLLLRKRWHCAPSEIKKHKTH